MLLIPVIMTLLMAAGRQAANSFSLFSANFDPSGFSDILNFPNDRVVWDETTITYKFDSAFIAAWPNPAIRQQVRLALYEWDIAQGAGYGGTYSYNRANGWRGFGDIRSVAVHEVGHVLGFHHPDQGDPLGRNFRPTGSTYFATADNNNEVMRSWINPGDYNHVLGHDELDGYRFAYNRNINFVEVSASSPADIVFTAYDAAASNWAVGGSSFSYRNPADHSQGGESASGSVSFNRSSGSPLGFMTLGINWDYENPSGQPVRRFQVRTRGTNNTTPLFHYDNNSTAHRFQNYQATKVGSFAKDDLNHVWSMPLNGDIPPGQIIHVGLEQDVWDWSVISAEVIAPSGVRTNAPLLGMHSWSNTVVTGTADAPAGAFSDGVTTAAEEGLRTKGDIKILARGIILRNSAQRVELRNLLLGRVDEFDLRLDDLNREGLEMLMERQAVQPVEQFKVQMLDPGQDFVIVLEGGEEGLPDDIRERGSFLILDAPDLLGQDLFAFVQSESEGGIVGNYALMETPPVASETAPQTFCSQEPVPIPDASPNGANSPVFVQGINGSLLMVTVDAFIEHSAVGDLRLSLISPDGTEVPLSIHNGKDGDNYGEDCPSWQYGVVFDDNAVTSIKDGAPPYAGVFRPEGSLAQFKGKSGGALNGVWYLRAVDASTGEEGIIQCWCLNITSCGGDCGETVGQGPAIEFVEVSPEVVAPHQKVLVRVLAFDDVEVTNVSADGHPLSFIGDNTWEGLLPAVQVPGEHKVMVEAGDAAGNLASDSSRYYSVRPGAIANSKALADPIMKLVGDSRLFTVIGRVTKLDGESFILEDGSGVPIRVVAPEGIVAPTDMVAVTGFCDSTLNPITLFSSASQIQILD